MQKTVFVGTLAIGRWLGSTHTDVHALHSALLGQFRVNGQKKLLVLSIGDHAGRQIDPPSPALLLDVIQIVGLCRCSHIVTVGGAPPLDTKTRIALSVTGVARAAFEGLPTMHETLAAAIRAFIQDITKAGLVNSEALPALISRAQQETLLGHPLLKPDEAALLRRIASVSGAQCAALYAPPPAGGLFFFGAQDATPAGRIMRLKKPPLERAAHFRSQTDGSRRSSIASAVAPIASSARRTSK